MAVPSSAADLSTTAASNSPAGSESIGTSLDDYMRAFQAILKQENSKGADIASAGTIDVPSAGSYFVVTGTTTITTISDDWTGRTVFLKFSGALVLTHSAGLLLPGAANITTVAGDVFGFNNESAGVWRCCFYQPVRGNQPLLTLGTPTASTSGTSIDFTSIPVGTRRITVSFAGVSTNGTSNLLVQIGDAGGVETSGYVSGSGGDTATVTSTAGFIATRSIAAGSAVHGALVLDLVNSSANTWAEHGVLGTAAADTFGCYGSKSLSATLDRVRITTVNGTDTFDAGEVNITYE